MRTRFEEHNSASEMEIVNLFSFWYLT